jgi:hypothetical protein
MTGFFDGGTKSLSFGEVNSDEAKAAFNKWRGGPIINLASAKQQTDWQDRSILKTWPNGDPVMQLPITLDTRAGKCPEPMEDEDDDGVRDWYITKGMQPFNALKIALRKAKVNDIAVGGELYGRWVSGVGKKGDPRVFEFVYTPPVAGSGGFMDDDGPAASQPPAMPPQDAPHGQPRFDPLTGQPLAPPPAPAATQPRFDPNTGQPIAPPAAAPPEPPRFDPASGAPLNDAARAVLAQHAAPAQSGPPAGGVVNPYARQ